jgi:Domain of unknown function (DUF4439)
VTEIDALQTTLAAEHAAVYLYGVFGARTSQSGTPDLYASLRAAYDAHRTSRDDLTGEIATAGETPVAAATAYDLPTGLDTAAGVTRAARDLERACAETYSALVAQTTGERRRWAVELLTNAAIRELDFRGTPEIFPGAGEYADR